MTQSAVRVKWCGALCVHNENVYFIGLNFSALFEVDAVAAAAAVKMYAECTLWQRWRKGARARARFW